MGHTMDKRVWYKDVVLARGSTAYELWEEWQRSTGDRKAAANKKLEVHMREVLGRAVWLKDWKQ